MKNYNVFVAFANTKVSDTIKHMLKNTGMGVDFVCTNGAELKKQLIYYNSGTIICGFKLKDTSIIELIDDIPQSFSIILIGNLAQLEMCENERVFKLAVPLKKEDLVYSVTMLMNINTDRGHKFSNVKVRDEEEQKLIKNAKELLIDKYNMTEEQAHRYMQKESMNSGIKIIEIAKIILN